MIGFRSYSLKVTPFRSVSIGEVTSLKEDPLSVDLTMFPELPTEMKVLSRNRKLPSHLNPYLLKFHCSSLK